MFFFGMLILGFVFLLLHYLIKYDFLKIALTLCYMVNFQLLVYSANTQFRNIIPEHKYEGFIQVFLDELIALKKHKYLYGFLFNMIENFKNDFFHFVKLIPAILLYSTFLTYEKWTSQVVEKVFEGNNHLLLELFKFYYLIKNFNFFMI